MATRSITRATPLGIGRTAFVAALAMLVGLVATIIVAAAIVFAPSSAAGGYTLGPSDDWGMRHPGGVPAVAPVEPAADGTVPVVAPIHPAPGDANAPGVPPGR
jgi:hypothetical protein